MERRRGGIDASVNTYSLRAKQLLENIGVASNLVHIASFLQSVQEAGGLRLLLLLGGVSRLMKGSAPGDGNEGLLSTNTLRTYIGRRVSDSAHDAP